MFCHKKTVTQTDNDKEPKPIDTVWVEYIGINKLGFAKKELSHMYFGEWVDSFDIYKKVYNFEKQSNLYDVELDENEEKIDSPRDLR